MGESSLTWSCTIFSNWTYFRNKNQSLVQFLSCSIPSSMKPEWNEFSTSQFSFFIELWFADPMQLLIGVTTGCCLWAWGIAIGWMCLPGAEPLHQVAEGSGKEGNGDIGSDSCSTSCSWLLIDWVSSCWGCQDSWGVLWAFLVSWLGRIILYNYWTSLLSNMLDPEPS